MVVVVVVVLLTTPDVGVAMRHLEFGMRKNNYQSLSTNWYPVDFRLKRLAQSSSAILLSNLIIDVGGVMVKVCD